MIHHKSCAKCIARTIYFESLGQAALICDILTVDDIIIGAPKIQYNYGAIKFTSFLILR